MENLILYCYKEWLRKEEGNLFKQIFKIPVMARVLFLLLFVLLIAFFVILGRSIAGKDDTVITLVLSAAYVILCIILSIYVEKYQVKHSRQSLEDYKEYCKNMFDAVLSANGFSWNFIPSLIERFNAIISVIDEKIKFRHEHFNKFLEMLLIPFSVTILGAMLDKGVDAAETFGLGLTGLLIILVIYAVAFFVLLVYDFVMKMPQGKYREFVTDLQSILDFKKCETVNESDGDVAAPSSTENTQEGSVVHT